MIKENRMKFVPRDGELVYVGNEYCADKSVYAFIFDSGNVEHLKWFYDGLLFNTAEKAIKYGTPKHYKDTLLIEYKDAVQLDEIAKAKAKEAEEKPEVLEEYEASVDEAETKGETIVRCFLTDEDHCGVWFKGEASVVDIDTSIATAFGQAIANRIYHNSSKKQLKEYITDVVAFALKIATDICEEHSVVAEIQGGKINEELLDKIFNVNVKLKEVKANEYND